jgi:hypothetical protein
MKAFPPPKAEFKPHPDSRSAKELGWMLERGPAGMRQVIEGNLSLEPVPVPAHWEDVLREFEASHSKLVATLKKASDAELQATIKLPFTPGKMQEVPKIHFLWFILSDHIHHRGQFSVYVRLAGGKVPSIYGASADEPAIKLDFMKFGPI